MPTVILCQYVSIRYTQTPDQSYLVVKMLDADYICLTIFSSFLLVLLVRLPVLPLRLTALLLQQPSMYAIKYTKLYIL